MSVRGSIAVALILIGIATSSQARVWYVKPDLSGDAPTIQAAMDSAVAGDEVLLAPGTYSRTTQGDDGEMFDNSMIRVRSEVTLRGEGGPEVTVLDASPIPTFGGRVLLAFDAGSIRIEGVTITGGNNNSGGAGIAAGGDTYLTLIDCIVRNNSTGLYGSGGGIACGAARIENCLIVDNRATVEGSGGGMTCGPALITGCTFQRNSSGSHGGGAGGAVYSRGARIVDCVFENNTQGGAHGARGGAIYDQNGLVVERSIFMDNVASASMGSGGQGGAIYLEGSGSIWECVFVRNRAAHVGGPANGTIEGSLESVERILERCTFIGNTNAVALFSGTVRSCIFAWDAGRACSSGVTIACSNLFGNQGGDAICGLDGGGNFSADPQFCATDPAASRNFDLQADSPCSPGQHPDGTDCGQIGARPVGCAVVDVQPATWSAFKQIFR